MQSPLFTLPSSSITSPACANAGAALVPMESRPILRQNNLVLWASPAFVNATASRSDR